VRFSHRRLSSWLVMVAMLTGVSHAVGFEGHTSGWLMGQSSATGSVDF
jgi:hypothetical protein